MRKDHTEIHEFRKKFCIILTLIDPEKLPVEPYCKIYLKHLLRHKAYYTEIYADVLLKLADYSIKEKEDLSIIDVGAGNGLLGIFAKFCGFGKVYLNDTDPAFIDASKILANKLDIHIDGFINGDVNEVKEYFTHTRPDGIVGTDVIEHIYDLSCFFSVLRFLNPEMVSVLSTASNPANYLKVRKLKKLQIKDELKGGDPSDSLLFGAESHPSYYQMRYDIIRSNFPELQDNQCIFFTKATKGLIQKDIIQFVKENKLNQVKYHLHSTNTCNPITGSWTERILTINEYRELYNNEGFSLKLYSGFYDIHKHFF